MSDTVKFHAFCRSVLAERQGVVTEGLRAVARAVIGFRQHQSDGALKHLQDSLCTLRELVQKHSTVETAKAYPAVLFRLENPCFSGGHALMSCCRLEPAVAELFGLRVSAMASCQPNA